jgi:putative endonuclease
MQFGNGNINMWNKDLGKQGELLALSIYQKKGYRLLSQNETYRNSELDLVLEKNNEILFVEVKTVLAENREGVRPEDNFGKQKQKAFRRGIELYLVKHKVKYENIRIDLACIYYHSNEDKWSYKLYENIILE